MISVHSIYSELSLGIPQPGVVKNTEIKMSNFRNCGICLETLNECLTPTKPYETKWSKFNLQWLVRFLQLSPTACQVLIRHGLVFKGMSPNEKLTTYLMWGRWRLVITHTSLFLSPFLAPNLIVRCCQYLYFPSKQSPRRVQFGSLRPWCCFSAGNISLASPVSVF